MREGNRAHRETGCSSYGIAIGVKIFIQLETARQDIRHGISGRQQTPSCAAAVNAAWEAGSSAKAQAVRVQVAVLVHREKLRRSADVSGDEIAGLRPGGNHV